MDTLRLAVEIHAKIVADCTYHGSIGETSPLAVYVMRKLPGVTHIEAQCTMGFTIQPSEEAEFRLRNTMVDLARFVYHLQWSNSIDHHHH